MTGIPEYGTGRHEDYLSQQDERAEQARDLQAEQDHAEWLGWMEANAYSTHPDDCEGMAEAFAAGMQAQRDLDAAREPKPAPGGWEAVAQAVAGPVLWAENQDLRAIIHEVDALDEPGPAADAIRLLALHGLGEGPHPDGADGN